MLETVRRIKWRNIAGLLVLIAAVFLLVYLVSVISLLLYGDCVEKQGTKVCFSADRLTVGEHESSAITASITNTGQALSDAVVTMRLSPHLENLSARVHRVDSMAPGDTVRREFRVSSTDEKGSFKMEFDIDGDGFSDKEIFLTVE